jgi:ribonuclease HI
MQVFPGMGHLFDTMGLPVLTTPCQGEVALQPNKLEIIQPTRRRSNFKPALKTHIQSDKDLALLEAEKAADNYPIRIYSDGSKQDNGVGAAASLYVGNTLRKTLHYHLGPATDHTVYEAEAVGVLLGLHLLSTLTRRLHRVFAGLDNQAVIQALPNQQTKPSHYLLDKIHDLAIHLQAREDGKVNAQAKRQAKERHETWTPRTRNVFDLDVHWVPGHANNAENEAIDKEAKLAAEGNSSTPKHLPAFLRKHPLPISTSARKQTYNAAHKLRWSQEWKQSKRYLHIKKYNQTLPSPIYMKLTNELNRRQASLLTQLRTGHIPLNSHLHRITIAPSPACPHCPVPETVSHFLLQCPQYREERATLTQKLGRGAYVIPYLLSHKDAIPHLLHYIHRTGQLSSHVIIAMPPNV